MAVGAIGAIVPGTQTQGVDAFSNLSSAEFLQIILTELSNQDPLNPQDTSKMMEQFSSLRNIQSQLELQDKLSNLVLQNQISLSGTLIGKVVTGVDPADSSGEPLSGLVTSVVVKDGKATLQLDSGRELPLANVSRIANAAPAGAI